MTSKMSLPDLEEDYEVTQVDGWRDDPYEKRLIPVGRCLKMCPINEMREREAQQRLSRYEVKSNTRPQQVDTSLAVKEYKRSCVGGEFTETTDLRPWSALKKTLQHLLLNICFKEDDWMLVCDFVFDRLKAVRQDMVIQRIEGRRYIEVLEGSIRFLIFSMYKLTCTLKDYSREHQSKPIVCLEGPLKGLNNYELNVVREMKLTLQCLRDCLNSLIIQYQENVPDSPFRPLFEGVNLIVNLPFVHGHLINPTEFQSKSSLRNNDPTFKLVFKMYREHLAGNHWSALKHLPKLRDEPLLIIAYAPVIALLQVHMVQVLKKSYAAGGPNTATIRHLCKIICPDWLDIDQEETNHFGRFMAEQFGIYDPERNLVDFKIVKENLRPRNFVEQEEIETRLALRAEGVRDNETRNFALQMLAGKDWSIYRETIKLHGIPYLLDPSQH